MDAKNVIAIVALLVIITFVVLIVVLVRILRAQWKRSIKLQDQFSEYLAQKIKEGKDQDNK